MAGEEVPCWRAGRRAEAGSAQSRSDTRGVFGGSQDGTGRTWTLVWQVRLLGLGGLSRGNVQVTPKGRGGVRRVSMCRADGARGGPRGAPGQGAPVGKGQGDGAKGTSVKDGRTRRVPMRTFQEGPMAIGSPPWQQGRAGGSLSRIWLWARHCGDKAKEPSVPFRWGPLMGTWHGGASVMQMGFEG